MLNLHWIILLLSNAQALPPVLRVSLPEEPSSLQWRLPESRLWSGFVMRGLTKIQSDGQIICDLCTKFELETDGTLSILWSSQVKWQDGTPLKTKDFRGVLQKLGAKSVGSGLGPHSLKLSFTQKQPSMRMRVLRMLSQPEYFPTREDAPDATIGPYQVVAWEKGKRLVLEANSYWAYPDTRPVYRLEFYFGSPDEQLSLFERGKIDIMSYPTTDQLVMLSTKGTHNVQASPLWAVRTVSFQMQPKLADSTRALREHILGLISPEDLLAQVKHGDRLAHGIIPPGLPGSREAPWKQNSIAITCRDISIKRIRLIAEETLLRGYVDWIHTQLKPLATRCGIQLSRSDKRLQSRPSDTFDLVVQTSRFDDGDGLGFFYRFHSKNPANQSGFANAGFDSKWDLAQTTDDLNAILQLDQILEQQEAWCKPLSYPTSHFLVGPRVIGFAITTRGEPDFSRIQLKDVTP